MSRTRPRVNKNHGCRSSVFDDDAKLCFNKLRQIEDYALKGQRMANTSPKPFVFVLMPFDPSFDDTYKLGIQAACKEAGAYCERVDEQFYQGSMLDRIYNQISKADIIVADMTGQNPNVFYETGYAHALNKSTILLTKDAKDIPFDLKHYVHIVYEGKLADLKKQLKQRIKYFVTHPEKVSRISEEQEDPTQNLEFYVDSQPVKPGAHITVPLNDLSTPARFLLSVHVDVYNPTDSPVDLTGIEIGLRFPPGLGEIPSQFELKNEAVKLPDGRMLVFNQSYGWILSKSWKNLLFMLHAQSYSSIGGGGFPSALRINTRLGMREIDFHLFIPTGKLRQQNVETIHLPKANS